MSMVVFPFREEDPGVALRNVMIASQHPRVDQVLAVGASDNATYRTLQEAQDSANGFEVTLQERIGDRRPGKGDGMNTGLDRFLSTGLDRVHFYDADITNFDGTWIDGAEAAADAGFPVVRHYFPRASTDAMITWMVTRPGFALTHPDSILWRIAQPLGGEILLTRPVAETLVADDRVRSRSDWGIDTVLTFITASAGVPLYEHYVPGGKQHALYGSLVDIRQMVIECFEAILDLSGDATPPPVDHQMEPSAPASDDLAVKVGYDVEASLALLTDGWFPAEVTAASELPGSIGEALLANLVRPSFAFADGPEWGRILQALLGHYRSEPGWQGVLFRLWVARVLAYTTTEALAGHALAMETLEGHVRSYVELAPR